MRVVSLCCVCVCVCGVAGGGGGRVCLRTTRVYAYVYVYVCMDLHASLFISYDDALYVLALSSYLLSIIYDIFFQEI